MTNAWTYGQTHWRAGAGMTDKDVWAGSTGEEERVEASGRAVGTRWGAGPAGRALILALIFSFSPC